MARSSYWLYFVSLVFLISIYWRRASQPCQLKMAFHDTLHHSLSTLASNSLTVEIKEDCSEIIEAHWSPLTIWSYRIWVIDVEVCVITRIIGTWEYCDTNRCCQASSTIEWKAYTAKYSPCALRTAIIVRKLASTSLRATCLRAYRPTGLRINLTSTPLRARW